MADDPPLLHNASTSHSHSHHRQSHTSAPTTSTVHTAAVAAAAATTATALPGGRHPHHQQTRVAGGGGRSASPAQHLHLQQQQQQQQQQQRQGLGFVNDRYGAALGHQVTAGNGGTASAHHVLVDRYPPPPQVNANHPHHHALSLSLPGASGTATTPTPRVLPLTVPVSGAAAAKQTTCNVPGDVSDRVGHSRDDAWSEGATVALIDAWGERYVELNRGNLKQKHWRDVADVVNRRSGDGSGVKASKTDVQCKNRLDTLKKKYKIEKGRIPADSNGVSKWPFFAKLDELVGPSKKGKKKPTLLPRGKKIEDCKAQATNTSSSKESADMTDSCDNGTANAAADGGKACKKRKCDGPFKDLAKAILKFGEVYERIECAKQQQLMDLERQRMEFTKDLELQRMQLFMQTQVELAKMKHNKHGNTEHYL